MYDANSGEPSQPERICVTPGMRPRRSPSVRAFAAKSESRSQWYSTTLPVSAGRGECAIGAFMVSFGTFVVSERVSDGRGTARPRVVSEGAPVVSPGARVVSARVV